MRVAVRKAGSNGYTAAVKPSVDVTGRMLTAIPARLGGRFLLSDNNLPARAGHKQESALKCDRIRPFGVLISY